MLKTGSLVVEGMSCSHCVSAVRKALEGIGANGKVNLEAKSVEVEYDETKASLEIVKKTIENLGYVVK